MSARKHPEDMERGGRSLVAAAGAKAGRSIGSGVWREWREAEYHPTARELAAFLRGYSVPLGGWLPEGMGEYLADRLEGKHPKPKGGRYPRREHERFRAEWEERWLAKEVLMAWARHREAGTSYPQEAAIREVAEHRNLYEPDVKKLLTRHRRAAVDSLRIDLANTRYPLAEDEAALARQAVEHEEEDDPPA